MHPEYTAAKKVTSNSESHHKPIGGLFCAEEQQLLENDILFLETEVGYKMWTELVAVHLNPWCSLHVLI